MLSNVILCYAQLKSTLLIVWKGVHWCVVLLSWQIHLTPGCEELWFQRPKESLLCNVPKQAWLLSWQS